MDKKQLILVSLIIFLLTAGYAIAQQKDLSKEQGKSLSELGVVYKGMPKEYLENAGFTKYLLISNKKEGDKEWLTFSDWTTPESGDTITFIIEGGKIRDWVRESKKKEAPKQNI